MMTSKLVSHGFGRIVATGVVAMVSAVLGAEEVQPLEPSEDDYSAIVTALANTPDNGELRLAAGTFTLTNQISLSRNVTIRGASRTGTVIDCASKCRAFVLSSSGATLADITVYRGKVGGHGGGVNMSNGLVTNCLIKSCYVVGNHSSGGGIYMTNGRVKNCEITLCYFNDLYGHGNAIWMSNGTVTGCDIHHNDGGYSHSNINGYGDSIVWMQGGTLEASRVHHNTKSTLPGVWLYSGTVRNCLIYANKGDYITAGVYLSNGGSLLNTTICNNIISGDTTGLSGIRQGSGTTKSCISVENGPLALRESIGSNYVTGGTFMSNVVDKALSKYTLNKVGSPDFVSTDRFDFRIAHATSPAVGYGIPMASVPVDFEGNARSSTAPTAGAYEYTGVIVAVPEIPFVYESGKKQVASVPASADYTVLENEGGTKAGTYPVRVGLTTEGAKWDDGSTTSKTLDFIIRAAIHLGPTNSYADVVAAINKVVDNEVIFFDSGTYTITNQISLSRPITLRGVDRDSVILDFESKRRGFVISGADSVLCDLTIYRGCVNGSGGGVYMSNGMVSNCLIKTCKVDNGGGKGNKGGGIYMTGGKVIGCEITGCQMLDLYGHGNAIWMNNGTVTGCDIHHNDGGYEHSSLYGDSIVKMEGGILETSRIHHNTRSVLPGIWLYSGTVRNCLIYGNVGNYCSAGLYMDGSGTVLYTTVSGNVINGDTSGISGLCLGGGTVKNSIIYGNGPSGGTAGSCKVSGGTFVTNVIDNALTSYPLNYAADPLFVGAATNDYRISSRASPAYGYAAPQLTVRTDITGFARSEKKPTCGAYEYDISTEKFGADIKIVQSDFEVGSVVRLEGIVTGAEIEDVNLSWYLDGELLPLEKLDVLVLEDLSLGRHTVKLSVVRKTGGDPVEKEVKDAIAIRPLTSYVNTWGTGKYPFAEPATATNSINAAAAAVWADAVKTTVVHVAEGVYTNATTVTIQNRIRILGAGRDKTFVVSRSMLAFSMANACSELCDLTVRDSFNGISVSSGRVHDFRLKNNYRYDSYARGSGLTVSGSGFAWNGTIEDCSIGGTYAGGGGLVIYSGVASNLVIRRCYGGGDVTWENGGAVYMVGGTLTHSDVTGMSSTSSKGLAVYATAGTLDHCRITDNTCTSAGYLVNLSSVTAKNCLFARNVKKGSGYSSILLSNGSYVNCTFAYNSAPTITLNSSGISARNTIFAECGATNVFSSATLNYCCAPSLTAGVNGNLSGDPQLKLAGSGNCHLRISSPCIDAGDNSSYSSAPNATDLDGKPRIHQRENGGVVDMGCYENPKNGFLLLAR